MTNSTVSLSIRPPYSLVLLVGEENFTPPDDLTGKKLLSATENCIAIGCNSEDDGETTILLCRKPTFMENCKAVFDFTISTSGRSVTLRNVYDEVYSSLDVFSDITKVRIMTNDPVEPTEVTICLE